MSVLVYTENWDGKFKKQSFELVSFGRSLAEMLNTSVTALSIGEVSSDELNKLSGYGAQKIIEVKDDRLNHLINGAFSSVISQVAEKEGSTVVLMSNNNTGKALAPRVSVKLKAGLVAGVNALPSSTDPFIIKKKAFTGKAFANVKVNSEKKILTLNQNAFQLIEKEGGAQMESFSPELNDADFKTEVKNVNKVTGKVLLTDAEIVVSGGR
ncbi:MAG: hypothetical protein KDC05_17675, partial [Bacteroidales bacterium]|nr:hypothetical protein [Bacteroidales bacterium]